MKKLIAVILFFKFCWLSGSSLDLNYGSSGILYVPTVMAVARAWFFVRFSVKVSVHSFPSCFFVICSCTVLHQVFREVFGPLVSVNCSL